MDETLNNLLREVILAAHEKGRDPEAAAVKAAKAYAAGRAAFKAEIRPLEAPQPGL
jgi:hypothetical protein